MEALALGMVLGLGVALSPGPSIALTAANTLRGGVKAGWVSALAATTGDVLIAVLGVLISGVLPDRVTSLVGVLGGIVVAAIGIDAFLVSRHSDPVPRSAATHRTFSRAMGREVSSPQALLFGLTAVGPLLVHLRDIDATWPWLLVGVLAVSLLLARLGVVALVGRTRRPLSAGVYRPTCQVVALALVVAGCTMIIWLGADALGV